MPRAALLLASALSLGACSVGMPRVPMTRFVDGDLPAVAAAMRTELEKGDVENRALVLNILAECEVLSGKLDDAWRHFAEAGRIMGSWSTGGGEEFAAIVGSEGSKTYKGDPYEKAMNAFYLAMTFLWRGEPDNARAALKRGILADGEVANEKYQADNALLFWLAGRMSQLMGLREDATAFFAEAQKADEFARQHGSAGDEQSAVLSAPSQGNVVFLVECGMGPEKFAAGDMEELARFRPRWHPARSARIAVDGKPGFRTAVLCDVDYQARTLGGTEMEGIREGKAVFKKGALVSGIVMLDIAAHQRNRDHAATAAVIGGGLLALGLLTRTEADVRHWPTLPSTVQVLCLDLSPGQHELQVEFLDSSGRAVAGMDQQWSIDVPREGQSYYLFRSLPGLDRLLRSSAAASTPSEVSQ